MDYNAITAWAGLGAALVAIYGLWAESRRHRFSTSLDLMFRLEDQFSTKRMYTNRKKAACAFHNGNWAEAGNEIDEIIDFFEGIAYIVEKGAIDEKAVWTCFFSYMYRFYHFASAYIKQERDRDPTLWHAFLDLYNKLYEIEQLDRRSQKHISSRTSKGLKADLPVEDLQQFLREEMTLEIDAD